jgi:hypothetical protein
MLRSSLPEGTWPKPGHFYRPSIVSNSTRPRRVPTAGLHVRRSPFFLADHLDKRLTGQLRRRRRFLLQNRQEQVILPYVVAVAGISESVLRAADKPRHSGWGTASAARSVARPYNLEQPQVLPVPTMGTRPLRVPQCRPSRSCRAPLPPSDSPGQSSMGPWVRPICACGRDGEAPDPGSPQAARDHRNHWPLTADSSARALLLVM